MALLSACEAQIAVYAIQIDYVDAYKRYIPTYLLSATDRANVIPLSARSFYNYADSNLAIEVTNQGNIVDGRVYTIERTAINGVQRAYKRHLDITPEQFTAAGFRWNAVFPVTSAELNNPYYILGTPLTAYNFGAVPAIRRTPIRRTPVQSAPRTHNTPSAQTLPTPSVSATPTIPAPSATPTLPTPSTTTTPVVPQGGATSASQPATTSQTIYYTSSHSRAQYYYPADCNRWKEISPSNLVSFPTVEALLAEYDRIPHSSC